MGTRKILLTTAVAMFASSACRLGSRLCDYVTSWGSQARVRGSSAIPMAWRSMTTATSMSRRRQRPDRQVHEQRPGSCAVWGASDRTRPVQKPFTVAVDDRGRSTLPTSQQSDQKFTSEGGFLRSLATRPRNLPSSSPRGVAVDAHRDSMPSACRGIEKFTSRRPLPAYLGVP